MWLYFGLTGMIGPLSPSETVRRQDGPDRSGPRAGADKRDRMRIEQMAKVADRHGCRSLVWRPRTASTGRLA